MTIQLDGSASATFATPLPVAQGGSGGVSAAAALINLQASVPAFSAYQTTVQALAATTLTKLIYQVKEFDLTNAFDIVTNNRFQPLVAGYYQVNGVAQVSSVSTILLALYKNGLLHRYGTFTATATNNPLTGVSALVFLNGSSDYIELFATVSVAGNTSNIAPASYFQAVLVRAA